MSIPFSAVIRERRARLRPLFNHRRRFGRVAAREDLALARADLKGGVTRYDSSPWASNFRATGGTPSDASRWVECPGAMGLRFVGYASDIAERLGKGWYTSDSQSDIVRGVVYQLTGHDGQARFVAGHDNADNGAADSDGPAFIDFGTIFAEDVRGMAHCGPADFEAARDAARAADGIAERMAETERDYQEAWQAGQRFADLGFEIVDLRRKALEVLAARRHALKEGASASVLKLAETARDRVESMLEQICEARKARAELRDSVFGDHVSAFNEGAGL